MGSDKRFQKCPQCGGQTYYFLKTKNEWKCYSWTCREKNWALSKRIMAWWKNLTLREKERIWKEHT